MHEIPNWVINLIVVPGSVGLLGYFAKQAFNTWQAGWKQAEKEKETRLEEWRQRLNTSLEQGRLTMQDLADRLQVVVTVDDCEQSHNGIIHELKDHGERITVLEVHVENLKGKK